MIHINTNTTSTISGYIVDKIKVYLALSKHKLTLIVVITSLLGFLFPGFGGNYLNLLYLFISGFLVTACANCINQILEKDYDAIMKRTMNRPIPTKSVTDAEAWLFAGLTGIFGIIMLWLHFGQTCALLGAISIISYAFVYTPLKRIHPIAVFIGAIPGALPPLIGYVAATGVVNSEAVLLFMFQFLWQFPHFWAIAWLAFDDYKEAGYRLLPTGKKDLSVPIQSIFFIILLLALSFVPLLFGISLWACAICFLASLIYLLPAVRLLRSRSNKDARSLMFASFVYLPIVFTVLIFG